MENIIINREGNFKNETISSVPLGINNINISNDRNFNLKKDEISNIKPMLSNNSNTITIPDGKRVKIKPNFNKKVPANTFSMMANPKKNMGGNVSEESEYSSEPSDESVTNEILTNNSRESSKSGGNQNYSVEEDNEEDDDEEEDDEDDYSSINSGVKNKNSGNSEFTEEDDDDENVTEISEPKKQKTYEEIQQEKQKLLFNLERLQKQGFPPSKRYTMASSYEDMLFEHDRLKRQRDVEKSIKFSRKILMAFVSGVEFLNGKFDPFDVKLEGWSENVMENVNDYDEVFEELHEKYGESVKMAPELKLLAMVSSSAFMFHLTNSLFKSSSPKLSDILKQNPDIMRNISEAAAKNMSSTIDKEFGNNDVIGNIMKNGLDMKMNQQRPQQIPSRGPPPKTSSQPRMTGPVGIDELLGELGNDDASVASSTGSITNMKSSGKRTKINKKGGFQLDLR